MSTAPQIDKEYVATGKVKVVYRTMDLVGPESLWAGEAAFCAGDQGKFWEYHDKLFASWAGENVGTFSKDNLKKFAADLGLDTSKFNSCLDSGRYEQEIQKETADAAARGVVSTPIFFVNNTKIEGAQDFSVFKAAIDAELKKAQ